MAPAFGRARCAFAHRKRATSPSDVEKAGVAPALRNYPPFPPELQSRPGLSPAAGTALPPRPAACRHRARAAAGRALSAACRSRPSRRRERRTATGPRSPAPGTAPPTGRSSAPVATEVAQEFGIGVEHHHRLAVAQGGAIGLEAAVEGIE